MTKTITDSSMKVFSSGINMFQPHNCAGFISLYTEPYAFATVRLEKQFEDVSGFGVW